MVDKLESTNYEKLIDNENTSYNSLKNKVLDKQQKREKDEISKFLKENYSTTTPIYLEFENMNYTIVNQVKVDNVKTTKQLKIVHDITGYALPNQILAILGPSGSGKTSLLNIIASRQLPQGKEHLISGDVKCNNNKIDRGNFGRICSYVMQEDILLDTLTPYECLYYGAKLKINESEEKTVSRVKALIKQVSTKVKF
jgi:ABC-type glutathione transport system ATPase component